MILVTSACGHIGSRVTQLLAERGVNFRAMSRTPDRVAVTGEFETVYGDFEDPKSLDRAFNGIQTALIVSAKGMPGKR
ncbi:MAG TPA: NAD(P)H-binding protein, partial [Candidatus Melainabacteria bacterium]|nr:NAD(P)H-binding protein [Candidatus Melainabacteria bacterium]